ncbi:hypothetical protein LZ30DRAFT_406104 [Colletotrichum cereale]|nr:hypothetical protein LZ30DRAFT_406104 [Colletotrichum cereale]
MPTLSYKRHLTLTSSTQHLLTYPSYITHRAINKQSSILSDLAKPSFPVGHQPVGEPNPTLPYVSIEHLCMEFRQSRSRIAHTRRVHDFQSGSISSQLTSPSSTSRSQSSSKAQGGILTYRGAVISKGPANGLRDLLAGGRPSFMYLVPLGMGRHPQIAFAASTV